MHLHTDQVVAAICDTEVLHLYLLVEYVLLVCSTADKKITLLPEWYGAFDVFSICFSVGESPVSTCFLYIHLHTACCHI